MVTLYLEDTYRLRGGGRGGSSISGTTLRGAVFSWAPPHPLVLTTDFTAVASVSLQRKPYKCIHTWVHMQHQLWKSSKIQDSYCDLRMFGTFL